MATGGEVKWRTKVKSATLWDMQGDLVQKGILRREKLEKENSFNHWTNHLKSVFTLLVTLKSHKTHVPSQCNGISTFCVIKIQKQKKYFKNPTTLARNICKTYKDSHSSIKSL